MEKLIEGRLYWITNGDGRWFPAYYDRLYGGNWSNYDTWEDFDGEVTDWQIIEEPKL